MPYLNNGMAFLGSNGETRNAKNYEGSLSQNLKGRLPYNYNVIDTAESKNTKYKYFQKVGMRRPEALSKNSVSLNNDYNNTPFASIERDKSFSDVMYATANDDKPIRMRDYRMMASFSEVADALDEICDETINPDENDDVVILKFKNVDIESDVKKNLQEEWSKYIEHYDLHNNGWQYFRQYLIEGELFFEQIIHEEYTNQGILGVINIPSDVIDPVYGNIQNMMIKGFKYQKPIFNSNDPQKIEKYESIPYEENQIVYISSGAFNDTKDFVIPFLENCRRAQQQLRMMEDAIVIHQMVHAPLRFVFNVDVGRLPTPKAEEYLRQLQQKYWSTKTFDVDQNDIVKKYSPQSTLDSYWFAKRQGQEATTVSEIGGQCLAMDTRVPLLDGRVLTIAEIADEHNNGKQCWVYSCDPSTGEIVPGMVSWAGVTHKVANVMKLTLDNGEEITCTPDHKFPIYERGFVEAKDLVIDDSLIPFNRKSVKIGNGDYEQIYQNNTKTWEFTHRVVGKFFKNLGVHEEMTHDEMYRDSKKTVIHHKDFNRHNNSPENLAYMYSLDHILYHSTFNPPAGLGNKVWSKTINDWKTNHPEKYANYIAKQSKSSKNSWESKTEEEKLNTRAIRSLATKKYFENISDEERMRRSEDGKKLQLLGSEGFINKYHSDPEFRELHRHNASQNFIKYKNRLTKEEYVSAMSDKCDKIKQHQSYWDNVAKLTKLRTLDFDQKIIKYVIDLFKGTSRFEVTREMIVENFNNNLEMLNHFLNLNKDKNICNWKGDKFARTHLTSMARSVGYSNWRQFRKEYQNYNHRIIKIEYLDDQIEVGTLTIDNDEKLHGHHTFALECGVFTKNSNTTGMENLLYYIKKLYRSLKVPASRLDPEDSFRDGTDILREELKFSVMVKRHQKKFASGLKRGFITHLKLRQMFDENDLTEQNISIVFNEPSNFAETRNNQKIEMKMTTFGNAMGTGKISESFAMKKYLNWSDMEILANRELLRKDMELAFELSQIQSMGPGWKQMMLDQANAGQPVGGDETPSGGGIGGGADTPPDFGGLPSGDGAEPPPNAGNAPTPPAVPEEPAP